MMTSYELIWISNRDFGTTQSDIFKKKARLKLTVRNLSQVAFEAVGLKRTYYCRSGCRFKRRFALFSHSPVLRTPKCMTWQRKAVLFQ